MKHDLDLVVGQVVEPPRLDDLVALVRERGRVDGDLRAHLPRRVAQRLVRRHLRELRDRPLTERPAGRREEHALHVRAALAGQALPEAAVLRVDRPQHLPRAADQRRDEMAAGHEHLFVGERDALARIECGDRGREAGDPGRGDEHQVDIVARGQVDQRVIAIARLHGGERRACLARDLSERARIACRRDRGHPQAVGMRGDDIESLPPDRAGRAEDGQTCHHRPIIPFLTRRSLTGQCEHQCDRRCDEDQAVDAVEHAAVPREERS